MSDEFDDAVDPIATSAAPGVPAAPAEGRAARLHGAPLRLGQPGVAHAPRRLPGAAARIARRRRGRGRRLHRRPVAPRCRRPRRGDGRRRRVLQGAGRRAGALRRAGQPGGAAAGREPGVREPDRRRRLHRVGRAPARARAAPGLDRRGPTPRRPIRPPARSRAGSRRAGGACSPAAAGRGSARRSPARRPRRPSSPALRRP